MIRRKSTVDHA